VCLRSFDDLHRQEEAVSQKRTEMDQLQELVRLHRMGTGCREVARLLGISPNTERQYREICKRPADYTS